MGYNNAKDRLEWGVQLSSKDDMETYVTLEIWKRRKHSEERERLIEGKRGTME